MGALWALRLILRLPPYQGTDRPTCHVSVQETPKKSTECIYPAEDGSLMTYWAPPTFKRPQLLDGGATTPSFHSPELTGHQLVIPKRPTARQVDFGGKCCGPAYLVTV